MTLRLLFGNDTHVLLYRRLMSGANVILNLAADQKRIRLLGVKLLA